MGSVLLLFAAIFQISDSTQAISAGLLRGIKDVRRPTLLIAIAYWVIGLPLGYVLLSCSIWALWHVAGFIAGLTMASLS